jgi:hypothetical protein
MMAQARLPQCSRGKGSVERVGRVIDVARRAAGLDSDSPRGRIHPNAFHRRKIDDQPVVTAAEAGPTVSAVRF